MKQYHDLLKKVLEEGEQRGDRTGTGTVSYFGYQYRMNMKDGFPLLTTKDMEKQIPKIFHELMWFIKGRTDLKYLLDNNVNIWNPDAFRHFNNLLKTHPRLQEDYGHIKTRKEYVQAVKEETIPDFLSDLGEIYGKSWRDFGGGTAPMGEEVIGIDQLQRAIDEIKNNPESRRIVVVAINPMVLDSEQTALPPCHIFFQFYVSEGKKLKLQVYFRSNDLFLGNPYNMASYAMLLHFVAHITGLEADEMIFTLGDAHIYLNHLEQVKTQLEREPFDLPKFVINNKVENIEDFTIDDFIIVGYKSHDELKGEISVGN